MNRTVLYENHVKLNAKMVDFGGWEMPVQYPAGIIEEHLATRRQAGLFDVSHMGRFVLRGEQALPFLQYVLTNNAAALEPGQSQYTMIPQESGGAIDDAYLYRFLEEEYLLVVNASNREKDWAHFQEQLKKFPRVECTDRTFEMAMISLQGPLSREIMLGVLQEGALPEPARNNLAVGRILGERVLIARTGYTGEPLGFELFVPSALAPRLWDLLIERGASPIGLGARDSLRLEAGLPLYGHELGEDPSGREIPVFACPLVKFAVSFSPVKGDFIGRDAIWKQFEAYRRIVDFDFSDTSVLPRMIRSVALLDKGIARAGSEVYADGRQVGWVTSGTMVPYWIAEGDGLENRLTEASGKRSVCLALLDSDIGENELLEVEVRGKRLSALTVPYHMRSEAPPYARGVIYDEDYLAEKRRQAAAAGTVAAAEVQLLLAKAVDNTVWRQQRCINLIPSEQTQSPLARLLSVMDPSFRYAEHKKVKALNDVDVFYYQGTGFINEVETLLEIEMCKFLGCAEAETRVISGQMANATVFSAVVDYINRAYRKQEQRRIRSVMNNHIIKGGHLSAQPMGALRDFIARDPATDRPAVVNFPVLAENPYKIDTSQVGELLERHRPELIILGKSMIIHKEPVAEIRRLVDELSLDCIVMYDMAHVLGLIGPHFQEPFKEGADVVTGSTHKTFFGTQRGVVGGNFLELDPRYPFWEAVRRRTFPGAVSNHHLGTMLGLLLASYEMNHFKDVYQKQVHANAKALAAALKNNGLEVAGDPEVSYTETHQVILNVGYGQGIEAAQLLEDSNIIVNYQAAPDEEGFTAAGSLRMGAQEMTRFGMKEKDMETLAGLIKAVLVEGKNVAEEVARFRADFLQLQFCFSGQDIEEKIAELHRLI
jgi:aminomethyltransferase